jgi:phosphoribosylpyrophosphate synthetase
MTEGFAIFCANANRTLAAAVARNVGVPVGDALVERFPDGEVSVDIRESVRDKDVFVIQSTAPPVNDHLMELLATIDGCWRASAARIFAVIPYFGYARSDNANNAGQEGSIVVSKVKDMGPEEGFNALNDTYENLVHAGVIDPTKVVRSALQNAASIAWLLLTTEALVSEIAEKQGGPAAGAGGMGGMY